VIVRRSDLTARLIAGVVVVASFSCKSGDDAPAFVPPIDTTIGSVRVHLEPDPLRLVLTDASGKILFDGLAPGTVAPPTDETDPPPLTGLAVRDVTTTVKELYGSYQIIDTGAAWRVATRATSITQADGLAFDALDAQGTTLARVEVRGEGEGEVAIVVTPKIAPAKGARTWASIAARCDEADRFLGFGAQQRDVEHRGSTVPLFVSEPGIGKRDDDLQDSIFFIAGTRHASSFPAPIYLARRGYVGVLDTPGRATFAMCSERLGDTDVLRIMGDVTAAKGTFTFRVFVGTPRVALGKSSARFGRPRLPPRLAFAPWNDAIFGSASVRAHATMLRDKDVPSSLVWTEDFRGGDFKGDDYRLKENWGVDRSLYPDIEALAADLHANGYAFLTYYNTFVEQDDDVWAETTKQGYLVKKPDGGDYIFTNAKQAPSGMIDLSNPAARAWTIGKLKEGLALGYDGWMGDYAEWLPIDAQLACMTGDTPCDPWAEHDLYPRAWQEVQRAALDAPDIGGAAPPIERRMMFVRSGWLGTAPLADVVWGGDQRTDMEPDDGLPTVVPMGLGLGIAAISTYGSDVGGYQSATNEPTSKETFFRWTELGAWSPVMRTHHGTAPKKEWHLDSDAETLAHYRRYAILHQQLLPTWEMLAAEATATGIPIWRHLALVYPDDPQAWRAGDQFLVGDSILVAPITTKGATSRSVYFPAGSDFFPWSPGAKVHGGATIEIPAALGEIPVFVRAGSIVVQLPDTVRTVLKGIAGVKTVEDVGDDRMLLVTAGPDTETKEVSGLSYALTDASSLALPATTVTWNGTALTTCATPIVAPCVTTSPGRTVANVTGPGVLVLDSARIEIKGGASMRALAVDVRAEGH
jgi:alpha-glucosidase